MVIYLAALLAPAILALFLDTQLLGNGVKFAGLSITGIIAYTIVAMQFVLAARISWIEIHFGFRPVLKLHKSMAIVTFALALAHVSLLVLDRGSIELVVSIRTSWPVFLGRVCLALLVAILAFSFGRSQIPINNKDWRWFHSVLAWTILLSGFVHGISIGSSFESLIFSFVWIAYFLIALVAWSASKLG